MAKKNAREKLSWHEARRCWKKFRKGKTYYLAEKGVNRSDRSAHSKALAEWRDIEARLDQQPEQEQLEEVRRANPELLEKVIEARAKLAKGEREGAFDVALTVAQHPQAYAHPDFQINLAPGVTSAEAPGLQPIQHHVDALLDHFHVAMETGSRSVSRAYNLRQYLEHFTNWEEAPGVTTGTRPASHITSSLVRAYWRHLVKSQAAKATQRDRFAAFKQFAKFLWETEVIDLPRALNSRELTITVEAQTIETFTVDDVNRILEACSDRVRLYALLALNCGITGKDISDLNTSEVNWRKGTVTRKRSKTRKHSTVPTVEYKLWPQTLKLLRAHRVKGSERVLLSNSGGPLVHQRIDDGKLKRTDTIRLSFRRVTNNLEGIPAEFTRLRRTGTTSHDRS